MNCILLVGMTGQGKSKFAKEFITNKNCLVFDVQNEYTNLTVDNNSNRSRVLELNEKKFVELCKHKTNTVCIFEEATGFFEGKLDKELRRVVLSKRHSGNVFLFCFHSISSIPPRLMQLTNYVVLYKTMDEPYQVEDKFPSLYPYYVQVRDLEHQEYKLIKTIPQ